VRCVVRHLLDVAIKQATVSARRYNNGKTIHYRRSTLLTHHSSTLLTCIGNLINFSGNFYGHFQIKISFAVVNV